MIILDTNVLSESLRPVPDGRVAQWMSHMSAGAVCTTSICRAELMYGVRILPDGQRRDRLFANIESIFDVVLAGRVLSFDSDAADAFAVIASERRAAGRPISQNDAMIAAIARSRGASLATRNSKDFQGCGIKLIDPWLA
jgi:predicted nucleic acid-binding protein